MTALALVDHEGRVLEDFNPTTPSGELLVDQPPIESLDVVAAREAARQSTTVKEAQLTCLPNSNIESRHG